MQYGSSVAMLIFVSSLLTYRWNHAPQLSNAKSFEYGNTCIGSSNNFPADACPFCCVTPMGGWVQPHHPALAQPISSVKISTVLSCGGFLRHSTWQQSTLSMQSAIRGGGRLASLPELTMSCCRTVCAFRSTECYTRALPHCNSYQHLDGETTSPCKCSSIMFWHMESHMQVASFGIATAWSNAYSMERGARSFCRQWKRHVRTSAGQTWMVRSKLGRCSIRPFVMCHIGFLPQPLILLSDTPKTPRRPSRPCWPLGTSWYHSPRAESPQMTLCMKIYGFYCLGGSLSLHSGERGAGMTNCASVTANMLRCQWSMSSTITGAQDRWLTCGAPLGACPERRWGRSAVATMCLCVNNPAKSNGRSSSLWMVQRAGAVLCKRHSQKTSGRRSSCARETTGTP